MRMAARARRVLVKSGAGPDPAGRPGQARGAARGANLRPRRRARGRGSPRLCPARGGPPSLRRAPAARPDSILRPLREGPYRFAVASGSSRCARGGSWAGRGLLPSYASAFHRQARICAQGAGGRAGLQAMASAGARTGPSRSRPPWPRAPENSARAIGSFPSYGGPGPAPAAHGTAAGRVGGGSCGTDLAGTILLRERHAIMRP